MINMKKFLSFFVYRDDDGILQLRKLRALLFFLLTLLVNRILCPDPNSYVSDEYIFENGKETVGTVTNIEISKFLRLVVEFKIQGKRFGKAQGPYVNSKLLPCVTLNGTHPIQDSSCIGLRFIVKYLPERPENAYVCFDRPVLNDTIKTPN
jgi:hypothetical protein